MDIIKFDEPLIGLPFTSGYRISFGPNDTIPDFGLILNHLCQTFGEGVVRDYAKCIDGPGWSLSERTLPLYAKHKRISLTIVVSDYAKLMQICEHFGYEVKIDYSQTLEGRIETLVSPLLFSKASKRKVSYLRQKLAELFHVCWYQVSYDVANSTFKINTNNSQHTIGVNA